ncbi:MAG TPA: UBP-type zinc finger domain-containing protein [Nitrososphaeraceae archaeon]|nr:UBP-type zinc finger domain-containing protein [Nitrososphaeraceae archaeon]
MRQFKLSDSKKYMLIRDTPVNNIMSDSGCTHLKLVQEDVKPNADGCEDCLKIGDSWVHLRLCLICGHVGCCDSSKNKHATKHFHSTEHPLIQSFEPDEDWKWCYVDKTFL